MSIFKDIQNLLSLKLTRTDMLLFNKKHLLFGIIGTWLVGMGRYWDDDKASLLQHLGLGSVIYIFILAAFIWLIVLPFKIAHWNYLTVLTFISLTSFPAILYAIPVERFLSVEIANNMNVWFLAIVAIWRLMLLHYFLKRFTLLPNGNIVTVTLMPICLIISTLTLLNVHKVVFQIMGGIRETSAHDASYLV
ncbi:MAG: hypothetical protein EOP53_09395 [Sphingobacteriales bacterium]|nr:MAG: hypothetical protein EOP53_09395 [Sphingobacteriales bacterium]